jgi:hypothetical protein
MFTILRVGILHSHLSRVQSLVDIFYLQFYMDNIYKASVSLGWSVGRSVGQSVKLLLAFATTVIPGLSPRDP